MTQKPALNQQTVDSMQHKGDVQAIAQQEVKAISGDLQNQGRIYKRDA
jgi:hypothetical protein